MGSIPGTRRASLPFHQNCQWGDSIWQGSFPAATRSSFGNYEASPVIYNGPRSCIER
jgi:hypothetical protein